MSKFNSVLIYGRGSIGKKHEKNLSELGAKVSFISQHSNDENCFKNLNEALNQNFDIIWICNETSKHVETLEEISNSGFQGITLVEKPLFSEFKVVHGLNEQNLYVTYNLRFHEAIRYLKESLTNEQIISVSAYVGQSLPSWRPNQDYTQSYSSKKELGGGVLRDLSHELDYLQWLFGKPQKAFCYLGKFSDLEIESEDNAEILLKTSRCPSIHLHMDYNHHNGRRYLVVNTNTSTYEVDLVKNDLVINGITKSMGKVQQTYIDQAKAILDGDFSTFSTYQEGLFTVQLIEALENSNEKESWIKL